MLWYVWLVMFISGLLLLLVSIILMFVFKVPDLLDELSGRKAKRQIKHLKELNLATGTLDSVSTKDVYEALSTGNLYSEKEDVDISLLNKPIEVKPEKRKVQTVYDKEESKTTFIEDDSTNYLEDDGTSMIEESTGVLSEINNFKNTKHTIEIIEEQSSIKEE